LRSGRAGRASVVLRGTYTPRFVRFFAWYVRRMIRSKFHAVRIAAGTREVLTSLEASPTPVLVVLNHSSWWDPLVSLLVAQALCPSRFGCAPMDANELAKFGMLRKLGIFGIDPSDPASLPALVNYALERFAHDVKPTIWITPQGRFMDVREKIVLRPGAAAIAARTQTIACVSVAIEYGFWIDQKPEIFIRLERIAKPQQPTTAHWHAAMTTAMQTNADALARSVQARDSAAFEPLMGGEAQSSVQPVMDLWLRLTGKKIGLTDRTRPVREQNEREND
jgi:1-acyl-sn-glycerol-3-phosphate acyltransferase